MPTLESVKQSIVSECEEDHVGLWSVIRDVEESFPKEAEAVIRARVLTLLDELLRAQEIQAGFPAPNGREFRPLTIAADEVLARIEAAWPVGRRPTIGEGPWFTKSKKETPKEG
ncbi:MAG: hypothetical protein WD847_15785 [Pirellulales bacterium]